MSGPDEREPELPSAATLAPPPTNIRPLVQSSSADRNLSIQATADQLPHPHQHQRGRSFFGSNPSSRTNSRTRATNSRPASRPTSWLVQARSDYTSVYDNSFGISRSRRTSFDGDHASDIEKASRRGPSRSSSFVRGASEKPNDGSRPAIPSALSRAGTFIKEDGESDSLDEPIHGNVSATKACLLLIKAFVGTGVLFLPNAFKNGGLLFSCFTLAAVAVICCIAFLLLVRVRLAVRHSFEDMGGVLYGKYMRFVVLVFVSLSQCAFTTTYISFCAEILHAAVEALTRCKFHGIEQKYYILLITIILMPLVLIRKMGVLSIPSMGANLFIMIGIVYVLYFCGNQVAHVGPGPNISQFNSANFALLIGTAVFSFEGIGLVIPVAESLRYPSQINWILPLTMFIVTVIFMTVGALGYYAFGSGITTIIVMALPVNGGMTIAVEILYTMAIILSVPLQLSPASKIFENGIFGEKSGSRSFKVKMQKNALRIVLVWVCAFVAFGIGASNLDKFVSFVGSVACMPLCFIFPAMFHYKACAKSLRVKILDILLGVFGVVVMIFTLYISIHGWVVPPAAEVPIDRCAVFV